MKEASMKNKQETEKLTASMSYWLIKSEPTTYSIDHLRIDKKTPWTGVRNYQARNFMRDHMRLGDLCLFYHSNTKPGEVGVAGVARVCSAPYQDPTSLDPHSPYFEKNKKIVWMLVDIQFVHKFRRVYSLQEIKNNPKLKRMLVVQRGSRLSIQPIEKKDFLHIVEQVSM
jgi:predicted RNA-binding protein with PUA-like domain